MFPMGYYDYGYGLGYGMSQMVPPPAVVNHQADENVYVAHHESNDGATIALLSFAAIGSLAGLLIARKANKATKLVDAVTHDLRATATKDAEDILDVAKKAAEEKARKIESDARVVAGGIKSEASGIRKAAAEELKKGEAFRRGAEEDAAKLKDLVAEAEAHVAELSKPITVPVTRPTVATRAVDSSRITRSGHAKPASSSTVVVVGKTDKGAAKPAIAALEIAGKDSEAAVKLYEKGHYPEALVEYEKSISGYEANNSHLHDIGTTYLHDYVDALHGAGQCHQVQGNYGAAIGYYDRALQFLPEDISSLLDKAFCLGKLGDHVKAAECIEAAARAGDEISMLETAIHKVSQKSYKEAAAWYKMAADKGSPDAFFGLAQLAESVDKDQLGSLKLYKQSLELYLPLAKDNQLVVERLKILNDKLRPSNPNHWYVCMGARTPEQIDNLSAPEKAIRDFINDEGLAKLLEQSNSIVDPAATANKAATGAVPTPAGKTHVKTDPGLGPQQPVVPTTSQAPATAVDKPVGPKGAPQGGGLPVSPGPIGNRNTQMALDLTTPSPARVANTGKSALKPDTIVSDSTERLVAEEMGSGSAAAELSNPIPPREATASGKKASSQTYNSIGDFAVAVSQGKVSKEEFRSTAAGAWNAFKKRLGETASTAKSEAVTSVPETTHVSTGAASADRAAVEAVTPRPANVAPQPEIIDLPKPVPQSEAVAGTERAGEEEALRELTVDLGTHEQRQIAAEAATPRPTDVAPQASTSPVVPTPPAEQDLNITAIRPPAEEVLETEKRVALDPNATHVGPMPITASQGANHGAAAVEPDAAAVARTGTAPHTAEVAPQAVAQASEKAVVEYGELTQKAIDSFKANRNEDGFAELEQAIKMGDAGARDYKLGMFDRYFDDTTVAAADRQSYFEAFIDFLLDSALNGSKGFRQKIAGPLAITYETKEINGIAIPKDLHSKLQQAYAAVLNIEGAAK